MTKTDVGRIYIIKNTINSKIYIGQTTVSVKTRLNQHLNWPTNPHFGYAVNKYGKAAFVIETLEDNLPLGRLNERETHWISFFNSSDDSIGYNKDPGGKSQVYHEKGKRKLGDAVKLAWQRPGYKEKWIEKRKGIKRKPGTGVGNNNGGKEVIDTQTGVTYSNIREASKSVGMTYSGLRAQLSGQNPNRTNLRFKE